MSHPRWRGKHLNVRRRLEVLEYALISCEPSRVFFFIFYTYIFKSQCHWNNKQNHFFFRWPRTIATSKLVDDSMRFSNPPVIFISFFHLDFCCLWGSHSFTTSHFNVSRSKVEWNLNMSWLHGLSWVMILIERNSLRIMREKTFSTTQ